MTVYLDTSALVKRYVREPGTVRMLALWEGADHLATSRLTYAETVCAFRRKARTEPRTRASLDKALADFERDWSTLAIVELTPVLEPSIRRLAERYALRGADCVHLASCLELARRIGESVIFACWDEDLSHAARAEGCEVSHVTPGSEPAS
ncbi:MAG: type II toxin-antitoxin system VapC family toxin [Acidobacteria bacterium]|nr:type II toxin-antitoxin system VapC family toxin [Acidobacteriota bacterium]MXZ72508.1 type II toxin-antitoxin system VapC family toxin [Acidobacteriota bacterium]MYD69169.1 type II toxin-antitoxin system VapC family toxin [Acidobacteriota bacterium]MYJ06196.1 type II toxin-antitoxin system VapC family toxin [Acidobacteriota bacterium]